MKSITSEDGTMIAYDEYGEGRLIICIFGATVFRNFFPAKGDAKALAKDFRVISYDRRGRGDSMDHPAWSIQKEVDDIEALIDANGDKAILYGHSSGGVLALEAAMRLGDKVTHAIIHDVSYVHDDEEKRLYAALASQVDKELLEGDYAQALKVFLRGIGMPGLFVTLLPLFPGWKVMKQLAPTLRYDMALTQDLPPLERIREMTTPLLLFAGDKNPESVLSVFDQISSTAPNSSNCVLEGKDHIVGTKILRPHIAKFLNEYAYEQATTHYGDRGPQQSGIETAHAGSGSRRQ